MGDEAGNFDPCECVWSYELSMRRVLNVIRGSQALCTDNECFETGSTPPRDAANESENVLLLTVILMAALFLWYCRPRRQDNPTKIRDNNVNNGEPPSPPPAIN